MQGKKVAIVMGSDSDLPVVKKAIEKLKSIDISTEVFIISAHRTPDLAANFAKSAISKNIGVIIAAAGMAAHLAGVIASHTTLPVIGLPIKATLEGLDSLLEELSRLDPEHYAIVDRKNPRRILHALEICHQTGRTYTSFRTGEKRKRPFNIIKIGLNRDRDELYERINIRVLDMMEQGLEQEARAMLPHRELNALNTVGYKEMFQYFDGAIPLEEAIRQIQSNSRRYARKQLTWYKRDAELMWFNPENVNEITNYIDSRL